MKITKDNKNIGKKVKLISNSSGNGNVKIGEYYYIFSFNGVSQVYLSSIKNGTSLSYVYLNDLEPAPVTTKEINEEIDMLEAKLVSLRDKIEWLKENDEKEFDEEVFKAWQVMKRLGVNDIGAAKDIVAILNS